MKEKIIKIISDIFKEPNLDKVSHARVMSSIVILVPLIVWSTSVILYGWVEPSESLALLVGLGLGGKVVQRFAENKKEASKKETDEKLF